MTADATARDPFALDAHNPSMRQLRAHQGHEGEIIDFCVPVNQYFPPAELQRRIIDHLPDILKHYPDQAAEQARQLSRFIGLPAQHLLVANGSTELITELCKGLRGPVVTTIPTFGRWTDLPRELGLSTHFIQRETAQDFRVDIETLIDTVRATRARALVVCNPDNPTGTVWSAGELRQLMDALDDLDLLAIDESFIDFADVGSVAEEAMHRHAAVVLKSMGKSLGWHGIRLGYAVASEARIQAMQQAIPYWNINGLAAFVLRQLPDMKAAYHDSFARMASDRQQMIAALRTIPGLRVWPSQCNFVFCQLPADIPGRRLRNHLLQRHGLFVRECSNKLGSSEQFLRLAVMPPAVVRLLVAALTEEMQALREG